MTLQIRRFGINNLVWLSIAMALILGLGVSKLNAQANTASMYLSPSSGAVLNGSNITVSVRVNSGTNPINVVSTRLSYPTDKFDYVGTSSVGSPFNTTVGAVSNSGGVISVDQGAIPASPGDTVTGDQLVTKITFKAKVGGTTATLSLNSSSAVFSSVSNSNILSARTGATYSLTSPTPPPPPTPTPTPSPSPSPSPSPTPSPSPSPSPSPTSPSPSPSSKPSPTPTPAPTGPLGTSGNPISVPAPTTSAVTNSSVTIVWKTSEPSTSEVQYGLSESYGFTAGDANLTTDHKVVISGSILASGTVFYYKVGGTTSDGKVLASTGSQFNTTGIDLTVTVVDKDGKAVDGAVVAIVGKSINTNKEGKAVVDDLPSGKQQGTVTYKSSVTNFSVDIKAYTTGDDKQELTVKIKDSLLDNPLILLIPIVGIGALIILGVLYLIRRNRQKAELASHFPFESKNPASMANSPYAPGSVINGPSQPGVPPTGVNPGQVQGPPYGSNPPNNNTPQ